MQRADQAGVARSRLPHDWASTAQNDVIGIYRHDMARPGQPAEEFPGRAERGSDPSTRAFRLPFQNLESSNHIAQWTERVVILE